MGKIISICLFLFFGAIAVIVFSNFVPYNMDEFSMYHVLSCHYYKYNLLNEVQEGCKYYDLNFLNTGLILPMREYHYMGSFTSIYYYPIFLLWKSPISARFMGIIFLMIQALILSQIFNIGFEYIFLGLAVFFQYFFQHISDTGVVGFQITSVFLIYYLAIKWFENTKIRYPSLIAIVIFLGIWTKLTFFWFLPAIGIIFTMLLFENRRCVFTRKNIKKFLIQLGLLSVLLLALFCLLFLSTAPTNYNKPYLGQLFSGSGFRPLSKIFSAEISNIEVFRSFVNPMRTTERIGYANSVDFVGKPDFFTYLFDVFLYLSVPLLWLSAFFLVKSKKEIWKSLILYLCFIITGFLILMTQSASVMHHAILSFPFLILSILTIINGLKESSKKITTRRILIGWCLLFIVLNAQFFTSFIKQTVELNKEKQLDFSRNHLNKILNDEYLSKNYFYVVVDWGMYYYQALYGKKSQSVLYIPYIDEEQKVERLREMSKEHNRKLLFIYFSATNSVDHIKKSFSVQPCNLNEEEAKWKILLEEDENPANICFNPQ